MDVKYPNDDEAHPSQDALEARMRYEFDVLGVARGKSDVDIIGNPDEEAYRQKHEASILKLQEEMNKETL